MKITNISIRLLENEAGKLKAVATIVLDDCVAVHDIKILQGEDEMFIAMPSKKIPNGTFKDIVHPINADCRKELTAQIVKAYEAEVENSKNAVKE